MHDAGIAAGKSTQIPPDQAGAQANDPWLVIGPQLQILLFSILWDKTSEDQESAAIPSSPFLRRALSS